MGAVISLMLVWARTVFVPRRLPSSPHPPSPLPPKPAFYIGLRPNPGTLLQLERDEEKLRNRSNEMRDLLPVDHDHHADEVGKQATESEMEKRARLFFSRQEGRSSVAASAEQRPSTRTQAEDTNPKTGTSPQASSALAMSSGDVTAAGGGSGSRGGGGSGGRGGSGGFSLASRRPRLGPSHPVRESPTRQKRQATNKPIDDNDSDNESDSDDDDIRLTGEKSERLQFLRRRMEQCEESPVEPFAFRKRVCPQKLSPKTSTPNRHLDDSPFQRRSEMQQCRGSADSPSEQLS